METIFELLIEIRNKLDQQGKCPEIRKDWIPKAELQEFLGFGSTQMRTIEKKYGLISKAIGKRKFYSSKSVIAAFNENKEKDLKF